MIAPEILEHLATQFRRAQVILFTGAGFSSRATNIRVLPVSLHDFR